MTNIKARLQEIGTDAALAALARIEELESRCSRQHDEIKALEGELVTLGICNDRLAKQSAAARKQAIKECAMVAQDRAAICADALAKIAAGELYQGLSTARATENCARMEAVHIASLICKLKESKP
jgi:uncharacterized coiled-coil protein SlyX